MEEPGLPGPSSPRQEDDAPVAVLARGIEASLQQRTLGAPAT
jgi:hypothetical protein